MTRPVRIAMLDSGVHTRNPHIQRPLAGGITVTPTTMVPDYDDVLGHGTAVCALLQSLAPEAELYAVRVFSERLATTAATVLRALDWCAEHGMGIVNLSLGTANQEHRPQFETAVQRLRAGGATVVSALEVGDMPMLPGCLPGVVGVVEDPECPRERPRLLQNPARVAACPFPLDIHGVPRERNLRGVSFAVAHVSAALARAQAAVALCAPDEPTTVTLPQAKQPQRDWAIDLASWVG